MPEAGVGPPGGRRRDAPGPPGVYEVGGLAPVGHARRGTDVGESPDVIAAREAGSIGASPPGGAYARLGHSSLIPFQTGRVGGSAPAGRPDGHGG
ncbi:hypothetical protein ADK54_18335, partial [Streptomyces sp. WM6378]